MNSLIQTVRNFDQLRVLVAGDVMLDVYDFCHTRDSKPIDSEKPGKRAYKAEESIRVLGGAGNVATNLAALGVGTSLVGITGDDGHHFTMRQIAKESGISHHFVSDPSRPTTIKIRLYVDDEYLLRRDDEAVHEAEGGVSEAAFAAFREQLDSTDAVIMSDYDKGFFSRKLAQDMIDVCNERKIPVIVDFKPFNASYFRGASIISPNAVEAEALQSGFLADGLLEGNVKQLHATLGCRNLVVTLGEKGMCGFDGSAFFQVPANKVEEVDAVGCGDTVRAVLALGYASRLSLRDAASLANDAAAVIVQKRATATINRDEVIAFIEAKSSIP